MPHAESWDSPDIHVPARLLADPVRVRMLLMLREGARTAGELADAAGVPASSASFHLRQLLGAGWVDVRSEGRYRRYELVRDDPIELITALGEFDELR